MCVLENGKENYLLIEYIIFNGKQYLNGNPHIFSVTERYSISEHFYWLFQGTYSEDHQLPSVSLRIIFLIIA